MKSAQLLFAVTMVLTGFAFAEVPQEMDGMPLLFSDDFENGTDKWEMTDPKAWKAEDDGGEKVLALKRGSMYEPEVRSPKSIAEVKDLNVSDFVMEVRVKQTGKEYGHRDMCFFFNKVDATHFYYAHIATEADDHANSIFLVNNEPRVSIAKERTDGTDWGSDYHIVRIKRDTEKGTIEVFYDDMDKPIMVAEDKHFTSGTLGVGSFDDTGNFDYVRIWGKKAE